MDIHEAQDHRLLPERTNSRCGRRRRGRSGNRSPRSAPQAEPVIEYGVRGPRAVAAEFHGARD
ncbi:hypothetical protein [Streptomyces sennicomposti]